MENKIICSDLVGKIFTFNGNLSTMLKKSNSIYLRIYCDMFGTEEFGCGTRGLGVEYGADLELDTSYNTIEIIDTIDNIKNNLIKLNIEPKWYVVDDYCATLIKIGGNKDNVEDRVAFIEKTPRILVNGEWIYGPKGCGGSIEVEGECIYGFYPRSREWVVKTLLNY